MFKNLDINLFRLVWGQGAVTFSAGILGIALPLLAALTLHATPTQMGLLATAQTLPWLLVTLFAGVWIDQNSPKQILVVSNYARGILLLSIPVALWLSWLSIAWLLVASLLLGVFQVFFELSVNAFVPNAVKREQLITANSQIESSRMIARVGGPGFGGVLVQAITAPLTILLNGILYFVAAIIMQGIPGDTPAQVERRAAKRPIWNEMSQGLRVVLQDPYLRPLVFSSANYNLHMGILLALEVLFLTRELSVPPAWVGIIFGVQSAGGLLGAALASKITGWLGLGRTAIVTMFLAALVAFVAPMVYAPPLVAAALISAASFIGAAAIVVRNVSVVSLRQARTPNQMQGRVVASSRFIGFGLGSLGGILGGLLAQWLGLRYGLLISALIASLSFLWLYFSPIRSITMLPGQPEV
ncbi:MAG: MFS transporter [Thermaceae bacterium]|nr:MFS transporter [Thermaceae bacterium]